MKQELVTKHSKIFEVKVNEDYTGTINGQPAHFDEKYNAMVLDEGYLVDDEGQQVLTPDGLQPNALRLSPEFVKEIKTVNAKFKTDYETFYDQQRKFVPESIKLVSEKFVYDSPFELKVATSKVVEDLNNLVYKCDKKLMEKIVGLQNEEGYIETKDLVKLPEYKSYIKELKKYDKLRELHAKKKLEFEKAIEGKTAVGMDHCTGCDNYVIIGTPDGKYLPKSVFFEARTQWLDSDDNPFPDFCLGLNDQFYYIKVSTLTECPLCKD